MEEGEGGSPDLLPWLLKQILVHRHDAAAAAASRLYYGML